VRLWRPAIARWRDAVALFKVAEDDHDLAARQLAALTKQVPLLYTILVVSAVLLAWTHFTTAPRLLTSSAPLALFGICALRLMKWFHTRGRTPVGSDVILRLKTTILFACVLGVAFASWSLALFFYGDAYAQCHVAFYMGITVVSCIFCLMHLRAAALLLTAIVIIPYCIFFAATGRPVFIALSVNMALVTIGLLFVMLRNYADFAALIVSQRELTARQAETQRLSDENLRLAYLDSLSSLPNRRRFFAELDRRLAEAEHAGATFTVVLIDLDRFKGVNDLFGHAAGDSLLRQVAARLKFLVDDTLFIARLGGDEFGAILSEAAEPADILAFGEAVKSSLERPCVVGDRLAAIGCSMGAATYPVAAGTAEDLFERADYALYHGKAHHRGEMVLFTAEHESVIRKAGLVEHAFRSADLEAELFCVFQPIVDIESQRVIAFESLARWSSPLLGNVGPDVFIAVAERTQSVGRLTEILLTKALAAAASWPADVSICFNLSAYDLIAPTTMDNVHKIVRQSGLPPTRIEFEVTETALLKDFDAAVRALESLREMGLRISLDDFGTGYSSLGYVHRLPLDKIKIDRSFVKDIDISAKTPSIVKTIVDLCRNLNVVCVVEGVETESQLRVLQSLGCRNIQGYLFSRPVPADLVTRLIDQLAAALTDPVSNMDVAAQRA
jgi:diguanylate cyclase (GGDEF)-like protein